MAILRPKRPAANCHLFDANPLNGVRFWRPNAKKKQNKNWTPKHERPTRFENAPKRAKLLKHATTKMLTKTRKYCIRPLKLLVLAAQMGHRKMRFRTKY